jgi:hypothetical protein
MGRPFTTAQQHVDYLVNEHNKLVDPQDTVIVNGDVCYQKAPEYLEQVKRFNGHKILIRGNHDRLITDEQFSEYFEFEGESRWMNFCPLVKPEYLEKMPGITHVDKTARVQTITRDQNPLMYDLLTKFKEKTGVGVLLNTSFNVDGKPILSTIAEAFEVFRNTQLDRLYIEGYYFRK